jgi:hypothetical protein
MKIANAALGTSLFALLGGTAVSASPTKVSGNELYTMCTSTNENYAIACQIYIGAYIQGFTTGQQFSQIGKIACLPKVTAQEVQLTILKLMREQPDLLHEEAWVPLTALLTGKYGCRPGELPAYGR